MLCLFDNFACSTLICAGCSKASMVGNLDACLANYGLSGIVVSSKVLVNSCKLELSS